MEIKHVRHVPIVDTKGRFVGLITHRDLLSMTVSRLADIDENVQDDLDRHIPISKVMQTNIITADPELDVSKAIAILLKNQVGCLPVVSKKKLIGIVTEADCLAFTYSLLKKKIRCSYPLFPKSAFSCAIESSSSRSTTKSAPVSSEAG